MELTERQIGRIEAACFGLAELARHNPVGAVLVNTIREVLDDAAGESSEPADFAADCREAAAQPRPASPADDLVTRAEIRDYGRSLLAAGQGLVPTLRMVRDIYELTQDHLAALLGVSRTTISLGLRGDIRPLLKLRMAEIFGDDGGAK